MAWNNNNTPGTNWQGNQSFATIKQLNSSIGYTSTVSNALSTTTGIVSNALQTEINSIVTGGTTSLWANYPAISNVNMNGCNIYNCSTVTAIYLSTMDLQVSSINGADISIFNSTITLGGVTIVNNSIVTQNITQQKSAFEQVIGGINAVAQTVSEINKAAGGFLSNVFGVVQQVYYAAKAAGAVVELATDVVELATASQALSDSRTINTISGGNINTSVYETFNHTAQLQFSTLMSTTLTFYRTTDNPIPNMGFGREIILSSYISAGSKCLRSIGDPMNMPIASTILLSTTNFVQSFGQWTPILNDDNNLNANTASISSLKVSSIYANLISSGNAYVSSINANSFSTATASISSLTANNVSTATANMSSINGYSIYDLLNRTPSNLSANIISTTTLFAQTAFISTLYASTLTVCNIVDNYVSTTTGYFDAIYTSSIQGVLTPYFNSTTTQTFDYLSSIYQPFINAQLTGSDSGPLQFGLQDYQIFDAANIGFWNGRAFKNYNAGTSIINFISGGIQDQAYIDISVVTGGTVNVFDRGGLVISLATAGTTKRITWSASGVVFSVSTAPAPTITTLGNTFTLGQSFDAVLLSTPNQLIINAGETVFNQQLTANDSLIGNKLSYLSSIQTNSITFTSPLANQPASQGVSYDLNRTFASTVTTGSYDNVSSLAANILNYNLSATIPNEATFYFGAAFSCTNNDAQWASQFLVANLFIGGTINLLTAQATNYFDCQNQSAGSSLQIIDYLATPGASKVIPQGDLTIYRFTATVTAGKTVWSYAVSPGIYNPQTVTNNLAISADLQNTYISSINRVQFNTGEVYFNAPIYAPFAYIDNIALNNLTLSTVTAINATISSASISSLTLKYANISTANISTFTVGNAIFTNITTNQATISNANISSASISSVSISNANIYRINGGTFYSAEVGTNVVSDYFTLSTGFTTIGLTQFQDSYNNSNDNLVPVNLFRSQLSYCNWPGWSGTYTGINLVYINSNGDVYLNGNPSSVPRSFNIYKAVVTLEMVTSGYTIPSLYFETPSQNFKALSLSNNIYAFLTFNSPSNPFSLGTNGPGSYTNGTTYTGVTTGTSYQLTLTQTGGAANLWQFSYPTITPYSLLSTTSLVTVTHAPNDRLKFTAQTLSMSAVCNVDFFTGNVTFNQHQAVRWDQGSSVNIDAHGGNWAYGETNVLLTNPYNGLNYTIDWEPTCTLTTIRPNQQNLAINAFIAYVFIYNGFWYCKVFIQTATVTGTGPAHDVPITLNVTMTPKVLLAFANPTLPRDEPDFSTLYGYSTVFSRLPMPEVQFSSITASTISIQALENISFNAAVSVPTFLGTGNVSLNANSNIDLMANYDINIDAAHSMYLTANSTIQIQGFPFDNYQGSVITSTPTFTVSNSNITNTSLVFLTPASAIDRPYWVSYNPFSSFCINVSSLASPTVMNYWVASYTGYGQQLTNSIVASGGSTTTAGGYKIHTFTTSGTFTLTSPSGATIYYLVIGGGGGGGNFIAGGGGAGGLLTGSTSFTATSYTITIGDGGPGNSSGANGTNGLDTTVVRNSDSSTIFDAIGGGGGGYLSGNGSSGGSGGGGGGLYSSSTSGGGGTVGQGYGGAGSAYTYNHGGGGGGAGGAGSVGSAVNNNGGAGGVGLYVAAPLGATYYAGGGGGGSDAVGGGGGGAGTGGAGGTGGGGAGGSGLYLSPITGSAGAANTGSGGGGGGNDGFGYGSGTAGGDGGSGIVILAYIFP